MSSECVTCHVCLRSGPGREFLAVPNKEEIEALTGRWRPDALGWMCPACVRRTRENDPAAARSR
jgi:ferredoxin